MARFQTPQFIEHESKVIGPFTFRRAGYMGAPLPIIFILYFTLTENIILFILLAVLLEGTGAALAFVKIGNKSMPQFLLDALFFFIRPKTFVWKRGKASLNFKQVTYGNPQETPEESNEVQLVQKSRIDALATRVQTKK